MSNTAENISPDIDQMFRFIVKRENVLDSIHECLAEAAEYVAKRIREDVLGSVETLTTTSKYPPRSVAYEMQNSNSIFRPQRWHILPIARTAQ